MKLEEEVITSDEFVELLGKAQAEKTQKEVEKDKKGREKDERSKSRKCVKTLCRRRKLTRISVRSVLPIMM